jgi:DNA-directed RNA polymerase specialized sigma24 family protein
VAVRLLRNPRSFEHVADVAAYVARVARNEWLRFVEEEAGRRRVATSHDAAGQCASTPGGDGKPFDRDDFRCLLEPRERVVFDAFLELAAIRAVAARLGLDVRQVRRSLAKIGVALRVFMLQNDDSCPP